jgi:aspartyl-tRNA(Asn)/glutamyl-tRNA(Gln) amidotransferase subunit C
MSHITPEDVTRIARLARIRLREEEREAFVGELDAILTYAESLAPLATDGVPPTHHALPLATPLREDIAAPPLDPEVALANAPARQGTAFSVPKVLDGEDEG